MYWVKNTSGKRDAMLTFALISFIVVTFNILVATFGEISFKDWNISFKPMDAATMTAYLAATFTAYVSRRWTDKRYDSDDDLKAKKD
tara:strand:+ start:16631 stop:16891 length:261 start_codon:yes stop_codon:yes gene_type:complete